jgi:hypothetical protein
VRDAGPLIADQEEHGQQPEGNVDPSPAIPFMNDFALCSMRFYFLALAWLATASIAFFTFSGSPR